MPRCPVFLLVALVPLACLRGGSLDYSKEALVFEKIKTVVHFSADGTADTVRTVAMKIQSDGAARQFGVLSVTSSSAEKTEFSYVRVRKPDGKIIETPVSEAMDVASEVARVAPMYSDLREQQLPVKGLAIGDALEFSAHSVRSAPEIPNQYWSAFNFERDAVILNEDLDIYGPATKNLKVVSPAFKPSISDEGSTRRYSWHYEQLNPSGAKIADANSKSLLPKPADIQISTIRSWDELGAWYSSLLAPEAAVSPAIASKAAELTQGLTTPQAKARALYEYVSMKFRYISISFGIGRYRPHQADQVIHNGYGDCKDKHTLLLALLKASGIEASTVLIGAGLAFDPDVPSPAQFNHVITAVRINGHTDWVDTTAEVAPYGLLVRPIRDHEALLISPEGKATIQKTPIDPPFSSGEAVTVDSTLDKNGVLTAHFQMSFEGDNGMLMRAVLRETAPAQWPDFVQNFSKGITFEGDVSNVVVENVNDLNKPLRLSYDYKRTNYSDWAEHKIAPPLPPIAVPFESPEAQKPVDDIELPAPGKIAYHAVVHLPKEYRLEPEKDGVATGPFGSYRATYEVKDGVLTVDRTFESTKSKAPVSEWGSYRQLATAVYDDHNVWMQLTASDAPAAIPNNPEAAALIQKAGKELDLRDFLAADADLKQATKLAPKQISLWSALAFSAMLKGDYEGASLDARKEIEYHPENERGYKQAIYLLGVQKLDAAVISVLRAELKQFPHQQDALNDLADRLEQGCDWTGLAALIDGESNQEISLPLQAHQVSVLLHTGKESEGVALARKLESEAKDPVILNNVAYSLTESTADPRLASECADRALAEYHRQMQHLDLDHFENADLAKYRSLSGAWDTAAWARFKEGKLDEAERYADAAWRLNPFGVMADHLGQILLKEGKTMAAVATWRMGLAASPRSDALRARLRNLPAQAKQKNGKDVTPLDQLNALRTIPLNGLNRDTGSADYFLLFSAGKVVDERLAAGELSGSDVDAAIRAISYRTAPPGDDVKIIRKAILHCSTYTKPKCELVLMPLDSNVK